jgi:hypothetical protein
MQADLSPIGKSAIILKSRSARTLTPRVNAIKLISRMRGGSQSQLMLCDDHNLWIVKFQNNPQHLRVLANELIATQVAEAIGLSVPVSGIIDVSQSIIDKNPKLYVALGHGRREPCSSGLQFGSQFAGGMISRQVAEYLAHEQLLNVRNLEQFAGILAFDKWTENSDYRQVVYGRGAGERDYSAVFIDQGACFNSGGWNFRDAPLKGVFAQNGAYSAVTDWNSFEPWLSRIEQFNPQLLWEIADAVPPEWYRGDFCELDKLVEKLISRRWRVRELIDQFRQSSRVPFPNWKNNASHAWTDPVPRYRRKVIYPVALLRSATPVTSAANESPAKTKTAA